MSFVLLGESITCDMQRDLQNSKVVTMKIHFVRVFALEFS